MSVDAQPLTFAAMPAPSSPPGTTDGSSGEPTSPQKRASAPPPSGGPAKAARLHVCEHCSQTFSRQHNLKTHLLTHSGDKPFNCKQCAALFSRAYDLRRHEKSHSGDKPYICPYCHRGFSRLDALNRHMRVTSADGIPKAPCAGTNNSFPARSRIMVLNAAAPNALVVPAGMPAAAVAAAAAANARFPADESSKAAQGHPTPAPSRAASPGNDASGSPAVSASPGAAAKPALRGPVDFDPATAVPFAMHPVHFAAAAGFSHHHNATTAEGMNIYYATPAPSSGASPHVLMSAVGQPLAFPYGFAIPSSTIAPPSSASAPVLPALPTGKRSEAAPVEQAAESAQDLPSGGGDEAAAPATTASSTVPTSMAQVQPATTAPPAFPGAMYFPAASTGMPSFLLHGGVSEFDGFSFDAAPEAPSADAGADEPAAEKASAEATVEKSAHSESSRSEQS